MHSLYICQHYRKQVVECRLFTMFLTCRFGPGEDESSSAALPHHLVARMDINAVDGEGPQIGDL